LLDNLPPRKSPTIILNPPKIITHFQCNLAFQQGNQEKPFNLYTFQTKHPKTQKTFFIFIISKKILKA